jgi:hypothetical protein
VKSWLTWMGRVRGQAAPMIKRSPCDSHVARYKIPQSVDGRDLPDSGCVRMFVCGELGGSVYGMARLVDQVNKHRALL